MQSGLGVRCPDQIYGRLDSCLRRMRSSMADWCPYRLRLVWRSGIATKVEGFNWDLGWTGCDGRMTTLGPLIYPSDRRRKQRHLWPGSRWLFLTASLVTD